MSNDLTEYNLYKDLAINLKITYGGPFKHNPQTFNLKQLECVVDALLSSTEYEDGRIPMSGCNERKSN